MATKQPKKTRKVSDLPPRPPQDLKEAVLFGAASEITPEVLADYVAFVYESKRGGKARRKLQVRALLLMATVGFAFINWQRDREGGG